MALHYETEKVTPEFPLGIVPGVAENGEERLMPPLSEEDKARLTQLEAKLELTAGANELLVAGGRAHNVGQEAVKLAQQVQVEHRLAS